MYSGALPAVLNAGALRLGVPWDDQADLPGSLSADWRFRDTFSACLFLSVEKVIILYCIEPRGAFTFKNL